jgi:hypothetical protein
MKYQVKLSQYGTVAYYGEVEVEADSSEEAVIKAEEIVNKEPEKYFFEDEFECVDGWNVQAEDVKEVGSDGKEKKC